MPQTLFSRAKEERLDNMPQAEPAPTDLYWLHINRLVMEEPQRESMGSLAGFRNTVLTVCRMLLTCAARQ